MQSFYFEKKMRQKHKKISRDLISRIKEEQIDKPIETKMRKNYTKNTFIKRLTAIISTLVVLGMLYLIFLEILPHFLQ